MNIELFSFLKYPFVYLDCSCTFRMNISKHQILTRKFLKNHPKTFFEIMNQMNIIAETEAEYYQQIISLQKAGIISSLITFEIFHEKIMRTSPSVIALFGQYPSKQLSNPPITFWDENINSKIYLKAASALLDANCIVADTNFFDVNVGKNLKQYIPSDSSLLLLSNSTNKKGDNYRIYTLSPQKFIDILHSKI